MVKVSGSTLDARAVFLQNTEGSSVLVIVGDCRGREVEQGGEKNKKKITHTHTLNGFACLVSPSARGVTVGDVKQRHALFLSFCVHSQATAQPESSERQIASRCVLFLYLAVHYINCS